MNLTRNLKQTAVYWAISDADGYGGYTFDDPVELSPSSNNGVRWEQIQKLYIDAFGEERMSESIVYLAQDVTLGGYLYLGSLDDLDSTVIAPEDVEGSKKIRKFDKLPDLKATGYLRKAWL
jgi:hypothetical protein